MDENTGRTASALRIQRLHSEYLVGRDHPFPESLRSELDEFVRRRFQDLCSRALEPFCPAGDESLWFIRQLNVDLALDATAWDPERLARPWAVELGRSVRRVLSGGERGDDVVRFPNRAAFLARFVADLASGSAWDKWFYDSFDSLRSLPTGSAICEALVGDASIAEAALHRVSEEGHLEKVLAQLSPAGARRIVQTLAHAAGSSPSDARSIIEALLNSPREASLISTGRPAEALRLFVAASERNSAIPVTGLAEALDHLLALAEYLRADARGTVLEALLRGDLNEALQAAESSSALAALNYFRSTVKADAALMARTIAQLQKPGPAARANGQFLEGFCGGAFLLLRPVIDSGISRLIDSIAPAASTEPDAAADWRRLVLLKCLGHDHALRNSDDSVLALAAGANRPGDSLLRVSGKTTHPLPWRAFVTALAERGRIETGCWLAELVVGCPLERRTLVIRDLASDEWLWAGVIASDADAAAQTLESAIEFLGTACGLRAECVFLDPGLRREIRKATASPDCPAILRSPEAAVQDASAGDVNESAFTLWHKSPRTIPPEDRDRWARQLSRIVPGATDLDYLRGDSPGWSGGLEPSTDLFWSVAARGVLKDFARRLIGFDQSSCSFLYRNFLDMPASIRVQPGADDVNEIQVHLQRPPLYLVLNIAGMDGESFAVPWIHDERVALKFSPF